MAKKSKNNTNQPTSPFSVVATTSGSSGSSSSSTTFQSYINAGGVLTYVGSGIGVSSAYPILSSVRDLRNHLYSITIGDYDTTTVTALIRGIEFSEEKAIISFNLDDKDTIREAFNEFHFFRLSYLSTKGEVIETYEIKTDPTLETKYLLPSVNHSVSDMPVWKIIWSPYTVIRCHKENSDA